jgi:hypothetical protein
MSSYDTIATIVKNITRERQPDERYEDLDTPTRERIQHQAEADATTPRASWAAVLAQRAEDLAEEAESERAQSIALAARR